MSHYSRIHINTKPLLFVLNPQGEDNVHVTFSNNVKNAFPIWTNSTKIFGEKRTFYIQQYKLIDIKFVLSSFFFFPKRKRDLQIFKKNHRLK